jgi:hypothetical protein
MKTPEKQTSVMVKIGRSELDEPRKVTFTNEHFTTYDIESEFLEACYDVCILEVPVVNDTYSPHSFLQPVYTYRPDGRRQMLKKLGKPSLSPPVLQA